MIYPLIISFLFFSELEYEYFELAKSRKGFHSRIFKHRNNLSYRIMKQISIVGRVQ